MMKLYLTVEDRLHAKYGPRAPEVFEALELLAAAQSARGQAARTHYLRRQQDVGPALPRLLARYSVTDLILVGATDVVPLVCLPNPLYDEHWPYRCPDRTVLSDLPWGVQGPPSSDLESLLRDPSRCPVARIPDVVGASNPDALVRLLRLMQGRAPWPQKPVTCFAMSARALLEETALCLAHAGLTVRPWCERVPALQAGALGERLHLLNAHGDDQRPLILDQDSRGRSVLLCSDDLSTNRITDGSVVTSLCCFGSALFSPARAQGRPALANAYLNAGAAGFFGPSAGTYGSPDASRYGSLLAGSFIQALLAGAPLGAAAELARRTYLARIGPSLDAMDCVVLAQYVLLGDPSFTPLPLPMPLPRARLHDNASKQRASSP